ncbi:hypothetical protein D3C80_1147790 [compost metagenome]
MLYKECKMEADNERPEFPFTKLLIQHASEHFGPPVVQAGEKSKYETTYNNIVEVGYNKVSIMILIVRRSGSQHYAGYTTHNEGWNKTGSE